MKYLICNLKSNKTLNEIVVYEEKLRDIICTPKLIICPSFPYLACFKSKSYILGAQDISEFGVGPYTGEVNGAGLHSMNVKYVIVGHSERRSYLKENETTIKNKIHESLSNGMEVIYCIGETKEEYDRKKTYVVLERQIGRILNDFTREDIKNIIIAYEPIWAISDGITPAPIPTEKEITEVISFIKKIMKEYYELDSDVLYGGSANDKNIEELKKIKCVDGLLIGGASLDAEKIISMIKSVN